MIRLPELTAEEHTTLEIAFHRAMRSFETDAQTLANVAPMTASRLADAYLKTEALWRKLTHRPEPEGE